MEVSNFSEIEAEFTARVRRMVWCNVATIDRHNRPRSRILHPLWEGSTGWILTHRHSYKSKDLAHNPYVSLAYCAEVMTPIYADCLTEWVDDLDTKKRLWELAKNTPEPVGFDPAHDFITYDHEGFGLLRLTPWRIALVSFPAPSHDEGQKIWHQSIT
jgi:uncharacterized pyridoxamine 5'-phosphate oxidase family protein